MSANTHCNTPTLHSREPRGLRVRTVEYARRAGGLAVALVASDGLDASGRRVAQWDPRLRASGQGANSRVVHSLTGQPLCSDSVDAGWRCSLAGESGQPVLDWDGRGLVRRREFDDCLRPTAVHEASRCVERLLYGGVDLAGINGCGRLLRHDHPAGANDIDEYGLSGAILVQGQRLLLGLEEVDWPISMAGRDELLELEASITTWWRNAAGEQIQQRDAAGHRRFTEQTLDGRDKAIAVELAGAAPLMVVVAVQYDAVGRPVGELLGNGITIRHHYADDTGRLIRLHSTRGQGEVLQDLHYQYDPVGNVTQIDDLAQPTRYFGNQRIEPRNTYRYDSLYQLIEATGWEAVGHPAGPGLPEFETLPADPARMGQYTQIYQYDEGNNLIELRHVGRQSYTRSMAVAADSNRALQQTGDNPPADSDFVEGFDANGNQQWLAQGQRITWDGRNQLHCVEPVVRDGAPSDSEHYRYDATGQRVRKVRRSRAKALTHAAEVRYLPGLEVRSNTATGEHLEVLMVQAGTASVRVLHWKEGRPAGIANDQVRYSLADHLGSATLELDGEAGLISQEYYYPFGGTRWWAGRNIIEAGYKTARYSGQERDATGLYYYGARYCVPWLQRWLSPDPAGHVDGPNLFRMVRNNPFRYRDRRGFVSYDVLDEEDTIALRQGVRLTSKGLEQFDPAAKSKVDRAFQIGIAALDRAAAQIASPDLHPFTKTVLAAVFGSDYSDEANDPEGLRDSTAQILKKTGQYLRSLRDSGGRQLGIMEQAVPQAFARAVITSTHGKVIWFERQHVQNDHEASLAATLIHEATHALTPGNRDYYAQDFWYVAPPQPAPQDAPTHVVEDQFIGMLSASAAMSLRAPNEIAMTSFAQRAYAKLIDGILIAGDETPSSTVDQRGYLFMTEPAVRQTVVLRNADSLTTLAMQFHRF